MNLPEEVYSKVITSFKDYSNMNVKKVKKEIKQFHHQLKRNDKIKESKEESIMQVNNKFKGKCYNYGEPGHQTSECTKPKKKNNGRQQRRNMKCYICGGNHYTIDCPQKKQNLEQAHMFVGVIRVIREKTIREKIEDMMEINKPRLVSTILGNMNTNQLFEPKGNKMINPQVSMTANQLLSNWLGQDNNILEIQYNNYMEKRMKGNTNKENINTPAETNMEIKENGWTKIKCKDQNQEEISKENKWNAVTNKGWNKEENQIKKHVEEKEENYYKTLSEKEYKLEDKFNKMKVVEEESDNEIKIEKEFIAFTNKKERSKYKNKTSKGKGKSEIHK